MAPRNLTIPAVLRNYRSALEDLGEIEERNSCREECGATAAIASALKSDRNLTLYIVGHSDNAGAYDYNVNLSIRRASAVVNELTSRHDIDIDRIKPVSVGPVAPVSSNRTDEGKSRNRRVELVEYCPGNTESRESSRIRMDSSREVRLPLTGSCAR